MEITKQVSAGREIFRIQGRMDAHWAETLAQSIEDSLRLGFQHLQMNLAEVDYLSSAGIRVLLQKMKNF